MTGQCCLDANSNNICDSDEIAPPANVTVNETENGQQEIVNETLETAPFCGDGICNADETSSDCCKDCNCESGNICLANSCTAFQGFIKPEIKTINFCGDGFCSSTENSSTCCIDCACSIGMICSNNSCTSSFLFQPLIMVPLSPERKLTTDTVTDIAKPRISEYFVAWSEYFNADSDIMLYNLQTSNIERIQTPSTQYYPDISAKRLVWTDYRRPVVGDNSDIYYYDLVSGTEGFVTSRMEYKSNGAIYGNYIAWIEQDDDNRYVYLFDLASSKETKLTTSNMYPAGVDVSGNYVVYGHYNCDSGTCNNGIKLYNIVSKQTTSIISTSGDINYYNLRIYGTKVVYISGKATNTQVNVYDISSKITTQITSLAGEKNYPAIYNNTVVWQDKRNGNWDIYSYDLVKKKETRLTSETHDQIFPDIYGNKVVYQDLRSGRHIYMYTLSN